MVPNYIIGLDLGQTHDYTALAVLSWIAGDESLSLPHLQRFPLNVPYPDMVAAVTKLVTTAPLVRAPLVVDQTGVGRLFFGSFVGGRRNLGLQRRGWRRCSRRAVTGGGHHDFLGRWERCSPDAHAIFTALHFQFGNTGFGRQVNQLSYFIDCHNGIA